MWRRLSKQLLYGVFYAACWALFIFAVYALFLKPAPSCFDNKQNQGEEGVDCGGPCAAVCLPKNLAPLKLTGGVAIFPIDAKHVSVLASLGNPNQTEAAKSFDYTFSLYGPDSTATMATIPGTSYAYAGEIKFIALPNISVDAIPARADITLGAPSWVPASQFAKPDLLIQNFAATISGSGNIAVNGTITNHDVISFPSVTLVAVFYGPLGAPLGVSETQLSNLGLNESRAFTVLHPGIDGADLSATKVFPYAYRP